MLVNATPSLEAQTISGLVIGLIAFVISQLSFVPQFIRLIRTRNTSGISLAAYVIYASAYIFYVIWAYGLYFNNIENGVDPSVPTIIFKASLIPAVVTNSTALFMMAAILSIKIYHVRLAKKLHVTELQLADILIKKHKNDSFLKKNGILFIFLGVDILIILTVVLCLTFLTDVKVGSGQDQWIWVMVANLLSTGCAEAMVWTQFVKVIKSKDTSGMSLFWTIFIPLTSLIFFTYTLYLGFARGKDFNWNVIFGLVFNGFIPGFSTLGLKIRNVLRAKKAGLSEIEYTKRMIAKKPKQA